MDACAYDCAAEAAPESSGQATCAVRCKLRGHPESPDGTAAIRTADRPEDQPQAHKQRLSGTDFRKADRKRLKIK